MTHASTHTQRTRTHAHTQRSEVLPSRSQFQNNDHFPLRLKHLPHLNYPRLVLGQPHNVDLLHDVRPPATRPPVLPEVLCSVTTASCLVHAPPHYSELAPVEVGGECVEQVESQRQLVRLFASPRSPLDTAGKQRYGAGCC